jgi:uncharacterized protein (DUF4415 family)
MKQLPTANAANATHPMGSRKCCKFLPRKYPPIPNVFPPIRPPAALRIDLEVISVFQSAGERR